MAPPSCWAAAPGPSRGCCCQRVVIRPLPVSLPCRALVASVHGPGASWGSCHVVVAGSVALSVFCQFLLAGWRGSCLKCAQEYGSCGRVALPNFLSISWWLVEVVYAAAVLIDQVFERWPPQLLLLCADWLTFHERAALQGVCTGRSRWCTGHCSLFMHTPHFQGVCTGRSCRCTVTSQSATSHIHGTVCPVMRRQCWCARLDTVMATATTLIPRRPCFSKCTGMSTTAVLERQCMQLTFLQ
jgi:hypothetical protein